MRVAAVTITDEGLAKALHRLREDIEAERLQPSGVDWPEAYRQGEQLSERFTKTAGTRTLDILHIASAKLP